MFMHEFMNKGPITKHNYVPTNEDIFIYSGKDRQRLIFGAPLEFTEDEMQRVETFNQYLNDRDLTIPEEYDFREIYRHYQGCGFNEKEAYESIIQHHDFIKETIPVSLDGLDEYLQSGMVYFLNRDKHFRPICIINVKKLVKTTIDDDTLMRLTLAIVQYVMDHAMRPGAIENWVVIMDCKDVGITEVPKKKLQTMVSQLQKNFRGRLYKLYALNMPFMLRAIWSLVKSMCDKFTQEKMNVYGSGFEKDLLQLIDADKLEKRFGGTLDDKESDFYPPQLE
jgi:hypothetical protein